MLLALDWKSVTPAWVNAALEPHGRATAFGKRQHWGHEALTCSNRAECLAQPWQAFAGAGSPSSRLCLCLEVVWQAQVCPELCFRLVTELWCPDVAEGWSALGSCLRRCSKRELELALSTHCSHRGYPTHCAAQPAAPVGDRDRGSAGCLRITES